jgi:hypothetical protein
LIGYNSVPTHQSLTTTREVGLGWIWDFGILGRLRMRNANPIKILILELGMGDWDLSDFFLLN